MNLLGGHLLPSGGEILIDGAPIVVSSPQVAQRLGIEMVHQHFQLVPNFTVAENLALAMASRSATFPGVGSLAEPALARAAELGWTFRGEDRVGDLSVGAQQRLEITKCLVESCRVLILDEPTAVLSPGQVEDLFGVLRGLRDRGVTILLIAHKLREILDIADHISVLRLGRLVLSQPRSEVTEGELARAMLGAERVESAGTSVVKTGRDEPVAQPGEILGIGGVDGNGQKEYAERLVREGDAAYIPQDRQHEGLALTMTVADNLALGPIASRAWRGWLPLSKVQVWAQDLIEKYRIKVGRSRDLAGSLSGGNQQKIVLARALSGEPTAIVAMNPTRGLDFASTEFVHEQLRAAAQRGAAVTLISSDRDELDAVADRVLYMVRGEMRTTFEEAIQ